jgi:hypothetical protein
MVKIAVYCKNSVEHYIRCVRKSRDFGVKRGGTETNHWALNVTRYDGQSTNSNPKRDISS